MTGMSSSWVRGQRHKRRHGLDHQLTVDPILIGTQPVYAFGDISSWIDGLRGVAN